MAYLDKYIEDLRSELTGYIPVIALCEEYKLDRTWVSRVFNLPGAPAQKMFNRSTWIPEEAARAWIIATNRNLRKKLQKV
jgi:hypothetical protein